MMAASASGLTVQVVDGHGEQHSADVAELRSRGLSLPHAYTTWPAHDTLHHWRWCRILDSSATLVTGFMVELSPSRAMPGTWVGRVERLGRKLHAEVIGAMPRLLQDAARRLPRVQRLDVQVFDENPQRRASLEAVLAAAAAQPITPAHSYTWTVILPLLGSDEELLGSLKSKVRRRMLSFTGCAGRWVTAIDDPVYLPRLEELLAASFRRTDSAAPATDIPGIFADANRGGDSVLVGAFVEGRPRPRDLIAFGWGRLHGDHIVYDAGGSERSPELEGLAPGYAVMWQLARWGRSRSATWFDLGGVAGRDQPDTDHLEGISRFKRGIAGPDQVVASEFRMVARPRLDAAATFIRATASHLLPARMSSAPSASRARLSKAKLHRAPDIPPILILGSGLTALGVMRICHRAGIPAYSLFPSTGMDRYSRWYRRAPVLSPPDDDDRNLESWLRCCQLSSAVLMPCSDAMVMETARLTPPLSQRFSSSLSTPETMAKLVDKRVFAGILQSAEIPHPVTRLLAHPEDLAAVPDTALHDAFLKPHDSQTFFARFSVKAFRIASRQDGIARMREIEAAGQRVLLQEYIPGPGSLHYLIDGFMDRSGKVRGLLVRRRLRMHPADFGNSSFMLTVPQEEASQAVSSIIRLLELIRFRGIFSAEFKRDPRDGQFKLLEVNARPWWYIEFTERCGVDVCRMAYLDALGEHVPTVHGYKVGRKLVYPYYDFFACRNAIRRREMNSLDCARAWLGAQQPLFNWSDPVPALVEGWTTAGYRLLRTLGLRRAK